MISISIPTDAIVSKLRAIPAVVTRFGGDPDTGIYSAMEDEYAKDVSEVIAQIPSPGLLVVFNGLQPVSSGAFSRLGYQYSLVMRLETYAAYVAAAAEVLNGVPTGGDGMPFMSTEIHPDFEGISLPTFTRLGVEGVELWQLSFALTLIGG